MLKFNKLKEEHLELVLSWRIKPDISEFMLTDVENNIEKQRMWFKKISVDQTCKYWVIKYNNTNIGLINLADIDKKNKKCSIGFYIGESTYQNFSGVILPYMYNHVFYKMDFNKIHGEVIEKNKAIMRIHITHGYREVGRFEKHIFKENQFHDVIIVELMRNKWDYLQRKFKDCRIEFEY